METVVKEITIYVDVDQISLVLHGLKPWHTGKDVKAAAAEKARELGVKLCPEQGDVMLGKLSCNGGLMGDSDDLASELSCDADTDPSDPFPSLNMFLYPCFDVNFRMEALKYVRYLGECERVRKFISSRQGDGDTLRPTQLPKQRSKSLLISGPLKLCPDLPLTDIWDAHYGHTSATAILLAANEDIFRMLLSMQNKGEYLIVLVDWDMFSYLFVRLMTCGSPHVPLVAVTDLDPHHLDLFTFLQTPYEQIRGCYGWDFAFSDPDDPEDGSIAEVIEVVEINWRGLRPSQCTNPDHTSKDSSHAFDVLVRPADPGFHKVVCMLKAHPLLQTKSKSQWLDALHWPTLHSKIVLFHPCSSERHLCSPSLLDNDFIAKKVSQKDWV